MSGQADSPGDSFDEGWQMGLKEAHGNQVEWKDPGNSWPGEDLERGSCLDAVLRDEDCRVQPYHLIRGLGLLQHSAAALGGDLAPL